MLPAALQRGNELVIHFSDEEEDCVNNRQISQDQILLLNNNHYSDPDSQNNNRFASTSSNNNLIFYGAAGASHDQQQQQQVGPNNNKERKMVHREIEKQRRKYMATLHASLRSLLPLQFIKGKRSVSDQMNEAVNYIKHLQKNVKEVSGKRDELKKQHEIKNSSYLSVEQSSNKNPGGSEVGIEVTASGFRDNQETVIPLSKLLQLLLQEGLQVVSCLSTHVNGTLLHTLHCQVKNSDSVDLSELRRKFANIIPSFRCSN